MLKGSDFVTSNVPGSPFPLYVAGAELERLYPFGPLSGTAANVTLLSHCGTCCIGINTDSLAIPDAAEFAQSVEPASPRSWRSAPEGSENVQGC